jgi:uncharacterized membrane protein
LATVALSVSSYLLWLGKDAAAGCGNSVLLDCESVLSSRWSQWMHISVSAPAVLLYAGLLAAALVLLCAKSEVLQRRATSSVLLLSLLAGGAGLWFVGLQLFSLSGFCPYCLTVHACGLTLAGLSILLCVWEGTISLVKPMLISTVGLLLLIGGQLAVQPKSIRLDDVADLDGLDEVDLSIPPAKLPEASEKKVSLGSSFDQPDLDFLNIPETKQEPAQPDVAPAIKPEAPVDKPKPAGVKITFLDEIADEDDESLDLPADSEELQEEEDDIPSIAPAGGEAASPPKKVVARRLNSFLLAAPAAIDGKLELFDGRLKLNLDDVIVLGSPRAPHVVVEIFDYSCHHCRSLHWRMEEVRRRYGEQLAVVMLPVPLNSGCNPFVKKTAEAHENACLYARLAIAVWQKHRSQFPAFHARLIEGTDLPEPGQMRYEAGRILGAKEFEAAMLSDTIEKQMKIGLLLYKACKLGTIPKLILGDAIATGKFDSTDELFDLFESKLGLKPLDTE